METTERRKRKKGVTKDNTAVRSVVVANMIILAERRLFDGVLGEVGMGYYAAVFEMLVVIMMMTGWYLPQAESRAVRVRMSKGQVKSAKRVFHGTLLFGIGSSLMIGLVVIMLSSVIAKKLLLQPLNTLAVCVMTPAVVLSAVMNAYRGYFEGMGTVIPTTISRISEQIFTVVFGLIFGRIFYDYGEKVGNLVQNPNNAPAYAVVGILLGILAAQILSVLFLVFLNRVYSRSLKKQQKDTTRKEDSYAQTVREIVLSGFPVMLNILFIQGCVFTDMMLYMHYISKNTVQNYTMHYGSFYGKYCVIIGMAVCLLCCTIAKPAAAIRRFHKRQEYRIVKDIFAGEIHTISIYGFPMAVLIAALAEPISSMFFQKAPGTAFLLQVSSALILFIPCALFFHYVLQGLGKTAAALRNGITAFVVQTAAVIICLNAAQAGIASVAYGYMFLFGVLTILDGMTLFRYLKYSPEYIRIFAVPFLSAAVSGVLDMLLAKALLEKAGAVITCIVCMILGLFGYVVLLFALKGVNERDLSKIPGGRILEKIGKMLRLF